LHDTGHSLLSHSSEQIFEDLACVKTASDELAQIVGKRKGAGESLAFAITISDSVRGLLANAQAKVEDQGNHDDFSGLPDMLNVALMIVGRTRHPFLQFLADVISSGFDADKLDYLLRDARSAGLPLSYDFERYFYAVRIEDNVLADGQELLRTLYEQVCAEPPERKEASPKVAFDHYETYRLRLPIKAMNTIEQIVICKLMLYSYIYHHPKVRAGEGMFVDLMRFVVDRWRAGGISDDDILHRFLDMTDASLSNLDQIAEGLTGGDRSYVEATLSRIRNRLLPREVFRIGGAIATGSERAMLADFLTSLQDRQKKPKLLGELSRQISANALEENDELGSSADEATRILGLRVDVPKAPKFEDVDELVVKGTQGEVDIQLLQVFPIGQWTHAYTHYRYYVRIFCYSEYVDTVERAAVQAMKSVINIESDDFYKKILRVR
jgi:HD superfamily phosphohydrolase